MSADALPTVQINGVVWAQAIVGNTVYVGGNFTSARPAGSALGTNEVPRSNFLAYDLTTGELITSVQLDANAQVRSLAVSPDGTRLYVGGDFTTFGGQPRSRLAAVNTATNTLVAGFAPNVGYHVYGVSATNSTVYIGGAFLAVGTQARSRLAAFTSSGTLLSWAPSASDQTVWDVQVSPDGTRVALAGQFENLNGTTTFGRGFAVVDGVTGATLAFPATDVIRNGGPDGGITTLASDGQYVYGGGYTFGRAAGVLEGTFAADWTTGAIVWIADCHGDTYSVFPSGDVLYAASHAHYCGNIGGFGQPDTWEWYRATAYSRAAAGVVATERLGYSDLAGQPRPDLLNFFPTINAGTFTGQDQGAWSVTGNDRYVLFAGEFTSVNGTSQQGLVRFQRRAEATNKQGPSAVQHHLPGPGPLARHRQRHRLVAGQPRPRRRIAALRGAAPPGREHRGHTAEPQHTDVHRPVLEPPGDDVHRHRRRRRGGHRLRLPRAGQRFVQQLRELALGDRGGRDQRCDLAVRVVGARERARLVLAARRVLRGTSRPTSSAGATRRCRARVSRSTRPVPPVTAAPPPTSAAPTRRSCARTPASCRRTR